MTHEEREQFKAMQQAILEMSREIALLKYSILHMDAIIQKRNEIP